MSEIDYDELDRAVKSLNGGQPTAQPSSSSNITVSSTPVLAPTPAPAAAAPTPSATTSPAPPPVDNSQSLVSRPNSGRFMDVMHPSSDMRPVQVPPRPTNTDVNPASPAPAPASPTPITPTPAPAETPSPQTTGSPFLPDTKVEKRPLGTFAGTEPPKPDMPAKPIGNDTPLPPELQDDLLSVETNEETSGPNDEAEAKKAMFDLPKATAAPTENKETGSILQQYVEKAEKPAAQPASIFEVGSHKPPKNKTGKKSGWMVVLWILILIILGAGAGAAIYFYVLPML